MIQKKDTLMRLDCSSEQKVFRDLGFDGEDSVPLLLRIQLLKLLKHEIMLRNWTQRQAAAKLNVKQPRISEIMQLRIDKFTVELLARYLSRLGRTVSLSIDTEANQDLYVLKSKGAVNR